MMHSITVSREKRKLGSPEAWKIIKNAANTALDMENVDRPCEISVTLTDDEGIRGYNREFRGLDKSTDVLSFPMNEFIPGEFDGGNAEFDFDTGKIALGDMVISLEHIRAQGEEFGHGFEHELAYITVHSVLHLLGYDHVDEGKMKKQMRGREKTIIAAIGV